MVEKNIKKGEKVENKKDEKNKEKNDNKNINNIREIKTNNKEDKGTQFNGNKNHKNFRYKTYTSFPHIKEEMKEKNNSFNWNSKYIRYNPKNK